MRNMLSRLLCLALCAALLCGLLPAAAVFAEETGSTAAEPAAEETAAVEETTAEATEPETAEDTSAPAEEATEPEAPADEAPPAESKAPAASRPTTVVTVEDDGTVIVEESLTAAPSNDASELPRLAAPSNLEWGIDHEVYQYNESTGDWERSDVPMPGMISWQPAEPTQGEADIEVYRVGEEYPVSGSWWIFNRTECPEWRSVDSFITSDPESGTYYFTVTAMGDGINYQDSETVTSGTWTYTKPSAKLPPCTNLTMDGPGFSFTLPDASGVGGYEVDYYFSKTEDGDPIPVWGERYRDNEHCVGTQYGEIWDDVIERYGDGYYYFRVRAISADITSVCNGDWSELSPAYNVSAVSQTVESQLGSIIEDSEHLTDSDIRDAVQRMDTDELKTAMLADNTNSGIMEDLSALEEKVGGAAGVQVSEEASAFDASQISIVGANLNNAASATDPITLVLDKPERDHVLDACYNNAVAVKFSMDLNNVQDTENLEVPVKITLPVPTNINPDFLVILHYHANGTVEELRNPYIFMKGSQCYASFVLTSFSDFAITEWVKETTPMYRLYNPNTGEHFYTGSVNERNVLMVAGWNYEGVGWNAPIHSGAPVYRVCNPNTGDHHYTMSWEEIQILVDAGWIYENVAWNSAEATEDNIPLYRLYSPGAKVGSHHYTGSEEERDTLMGYGWNYEGIAWYGTLK